jgi:O-antigen/teichoic acid export membrane protein
MLELKSRANVMVGTLVYPLLAFAFVFAEEMVTIIYTAAYVDAAPVMRVSIVGFAALVVEFTSIVQLLRQGAFMIRMGLAALVLSVALSWFSAHHFGLAGAAAGSVTTIYFELVATLRQVSLRTGVPLGRMQNWRALGLLMLSAALAAAFAWSMVGRYFVASGPLVRLIVGGVFLAAAYVAMAALLGVGRGWFAAVRDSEHGL